MWRSVPAAVPDRLKGAGSVDGKKEKADKQRRRKRK